jgi:hypothetical protein
MNRVLGRNIYVVQLAKVVQAAGGPKAFAKICQDCKFRAVWARLGHAQTLCSNFDPIRNPALPQIQAELAAVGVALWGWHVPQCPPDNTPGHVKTANATAEAKLVIKWAADNALAGLLLDAEQNDTPQNDPSQRYFQGGVDEATAYASAIQQACIQSGRGLALSSHDTPQVHGGFPFDVFLKYVTDNCPQVYYSPAHPPAARMNNSITGYTPLESGRNFQDRYKPVGNITTKDDVALPDDPTCIAYFKTFLGLVRAGGYKAYSLWCWDDAPAAIFDTLRTTPEFGP